MPLPSSAATLCACCIFYSFALQSYRTGAVGLGTMVMRAHANKASEDEAALISKKGEEELAAKLLSTRFNFVAGYMNS